MPPLSVLEMAKLYAKHQKEWAREAMKRESRRVGKGDIIPWLTKRLGRSWAHRAAYFPVIDDWYPAFELPEGKYILVLIDGPVGDYWRVYLSGADDHSVEYTFSSLIEAEAFWDALAAEPELCHTMISLLYEPFCPW